MDPFKFLLTQQIGVICGNIGEIFGDWYLLFRTRAVVKNKTTLRPVYISCIFFNLTKIATILLHWSYSPTNLQSSIDGTYNQKDMDLFYFNFWLLQLIIIYASVIYDITVYFVLKKNVFKDMNKHIQFGFIKNFKNISEFRIIICTLISIVFLPIVSFIIIIKFYLYYSKDYSNLDFRFGSSITGVQYFMIFIDQILLMRPTSESSAASSEVYSYTPSGIKLSNSSSNVFNVSKSNTSLDNTAFNNGKFQYTNINSNPSLI